MCNASFGAGSCRFLTASIRTAFTTAVSHTKPRSSPSSLTTAWDLAAKTAAMLNAEITMRHRRFRTSIVLATLPATMRHAIVGSISSRLGTSLDLAAPSTTMTLTKPGLTPGAFCASLKLTPHGPVLRAKHLFRSDWLLTFANSTDLRDSALVSFTKVRPFFTNQSTILGSAESM